MTQTQNTQQQQILEQLENYKARIQEMIRNKQINTEEAKEILGKINNIVTKVLETRGLSKLGKFRLEKMGGCRYCDGWYISVWKELYEKGVPLSITRVNENVNEEWHRYGYCHGDFDGATCNTSISRGLFRKLIENFDNLVEDVKKLLEEAEQYPVFV
jgi:hypothetical protein